MVYSGLIHLINKYSTKDWMLGVHHHWEMNDVRVYALYKIHTHVENATDFKIGICATQSYKKQIEKLSKRNWIYRIRKLCICMDW